MKKIQTNTNKMPINWTQMFAKYKGLWVALAEDEKTVVAASKNAKDAYAAARKKGIEVPIMLSIPSEIKSHIGNSYRTSHGRDEIQI